MLEKMFQTRMRGYERACWVNTVWNRLVRLASEARHSSVVVVPFLGNLSASQHRLGGGNINHSRSITVHMAVDPATPDMAASSPATESSAAPEPYKIRTLSKFQPAVKSYAGFGTALAGIVLFTFACAVGGMLHIMKPHA
eukprot:g36968.t1